MRKLLPRLRWWVGVPHQPFAPREAFASRSTPTEQTHPQYGAVIGPYRSKRGAFYAAANPWVRSIRHAEECAARSAAQSMLANDYKRKL